MNHFLSKKRRNFTQYVLNCQIIITIYTTFSRNHISTHILQKKTIQFQNWIARFNFLFVKVCQCLLSIGRNTNIRCVGLLFVVCSSLRTGNSCLVALSKYTTWLNKIISLFCNFRNFRYDYTLFTPYTITDIDTLALRNKVELF